MNDLLAKHARNVSLMTCFLERFFDARNLTHHILVFITVPVLIISCSEGRTKSAPVKKRVYEDRTSEVNVMILEKAVFRKEIVSNGKLKAYRKGALRFKVPGELKELKVRNGNVVTKGESIAVLDQFEYRQRLHQAETNLKRTSIELEDALIAYGGLMKRENIPRAIYESASIRTGYVAAINDLKTAQFNLDQTILKAPFSGKIANLKQKEFEMVATGEPFCTLIDDAAFEVEFHLIESEIGKVALNDRVEVLPFSTGEYFIGKVSEINPFVDENGLVLVKAIVKNDGNLWEGMNVKVSIEKEELGHLVVPKSAVVLRQNQEVLFKYVNGSAFWTYVQTDLENSSSYSVIVHPDKEGELKAGDTVIISNNINLAHGSQVKVRAKELTGRR